MKKLATFSKIISTIGVAGGVVVSNSIIGWLNSKSLPLWFTLSIGIVIVAIFYGLFSEGSKYLVSSSVFFRRVILGRKFVEGTWMDIVNTDGLLTFVGVLRVEFDEFALRLSGENFDGNGNAKGTFKSEMAVLDWPVLKYKYTSTCHESKKSHSEGYGELHFIERDGEPKRYQGFFMDLNEVLRKETYGWKVTNVDNLEKLDSPKSIPLAIQKIVSNVEKDIHQSEMDQGEMR